MRYFIASVIGIILTAETQAAIVAFLKPDPVAIIVQGNDSDAKRIYDSLDIPATEKPGSILEKVLESPSGQVVFGCRFSTLTDGASCTVKIKRRQNFEVSEEKKRAYLVSYQLDDTAFLFDRLVKNSEGKVPMYVSEKQDFAFSSSTERFILSYQQVN